MITFADLKETIVKYHRLMISGKFEWKTSSDSEPEEVEDSLYAVFDFRVFDVKNEDGTKKEELMGWRLKLLHGTIGICSFHHFTKPWFYERTMVIKCFVLALLEHRLYKTVFVLMLDHMKDPRCVVGLVSELEHVKRQSSLLMDLITKCAECGFAEPLDAIINYNWEKLFKDNEKLVDDIASDSFGVQSWLFFNIDTLINCSIENNHTECTAILLRWKQDNVLLREGDIEL
jgi:hypothetical protein